MMKGVLVSSRLGLKTWALFSTAMIFLVLLFSCWSALENSRHQHMSWQERMLTVCQCFADMVDGSALQNARTTIVPSSAWKLGRTLFSTCKPKGRYAIGIFRATAAQSGTPVTYHYLQGKGCQLDIFAVAHAKLIAAFQKGLRFECMSGRHEDIYVALTPVASKAKDKQPLGFIALLMPTVLAVHHTTYWWTNLWAATLIFILLGIITAGGLAHFFTSQMLPDFHKVSQGIATEIKALQQYNQEQHQQLEQVLKAIQQDSQVIRIAVNESMRINEGLIQDAQKTASQMNTIAVSLEKQLARTERMTSSLTEMSTAVKEVASNAEAAVATSQASVADAKRGGEVVNQIIKHMNKITRTVAKTAEVIRSLGKRSDEIGDIIDVIDDIADQTNLLALNAAIEAARAGKQGRGFEVVADEVRKLAEKTTHATKEIASTITSIQEESTRAGAAMDDGIREIDIGAGFAVQAGVSLQKIVAGAKRVMEKISTIAKAAEKQATTAEIISELVDQVSRGAQRNTEQTRMMAARFQELSQRVEQLSEKLRNFSQTWSQEGGYRFNPCTVRFDNLLQRLHEWQEILQLYH